MARNKALKDLASVSLEALQPKLHSLLADSAVCVFRGRSDPNSPPSDQLVSEHLTTPLQWLLCGGDPAAMFAGLEQNKTPSVFCGKVFKSGEPAYFCKDCQTDPTCCLCMECFEHSEHKHHRYRFFASGGGGCCDCGDPEAWKTEVYCDLHQPSQQPDDQEDPVQALSSDQAHRARLFLTALLTYCMDVMTWEGPGPLPPNLQTGQTAQSLMDSKHQTFLYNDELHSFDEVIQALTHRVSLTHTQAVSMATFIDRKGRAAIKCGTEEECRRVQDVINTDLSNNPLKVYCYHEVVVAHQNTAILCLSIAKELAEKSPAFSRLLSISLCETTPTSGRTLLDKFFLCDSQLWINARVGWHRLVMSSIFMDSVYKKQLAISLAKNYLELEKNFVADSHDHDVCATNITVQIFTVPSLSRMLVVEHGLLKTIVDTLLELLCPCIDSTTHMYKLSARNYKHSRIFFIMHDLRYVLRNKPEEWSDQLRRCVIEAYHSVLQLLGLMQNADSVRRRAHGLHVEREEPWEHLFNFSIVLQPALLLLVEWITSDAVVLKEAVTATLQKHSTVAEWNKMVLHPHSCSRELVGRNRMDLVKFDIVGDPVSIHQPLPRLIACLLTGAAAHGLKIEQLLSIQPSNSRTPLFLIEHCSRAVVMAIQVMAGMWKRNGYSVVNQIINYQFHYSREIMYDKDILMLQCMASVMDLNVFTYALIYKFRLEKWINNPEGDPQRDRDPPDDALRFFISEAEDFLFLLITIFTERHSRGVGVGVSKEDGLRREIIHRLFITPLIHSQIVKLFRLNENENQIDQILKEVAVQKRVGNKMLFELKPELESEYNPFYFHYNRMDHSKAHEAYRKRHKPPASGARQITPTPPQRPPTFTPPFQGIMRFPQCPVIHRVLLCVLKQAATQSSKFWSDKLIHEALYLLAVMMLEEDPAQPMSLRNIALGNTGGDTSLFGHLEELKANRRADEYLPLLEWILQYLATPTNSDAEDPVAMDTTSSSPVEPVPAPPTLVDPSVDEEAIKKRKKLAAEKRKNLMSQMAQMQRNFLKVHKAELDKISLGGGRRPGEDFVDFPQDKCGVGVASRVDRTQTPQEATCILCQEESKDISSDGKMFVQAVFVQRSAVLRKGQPQEGVKENDFLLSRANLSHGLFTGGCGHHMHAECWRGFLETKQRERQRQHFFMLPGNSVQWERGEFLCPLCQSPSNTVLPLLMPHPLTTPPTRPSMEVSLYEWRRLGEMAVELAEGDPMDTDSSSVDPTFHDKVYTLFPSYQRPIREQHHSSQNEELSAVLTLFSQAVFTKEYEVLANEVDPRVCVALWNSCACTIASLEHNARSQDKFLLQTDTLSTRQMDTVKSLVRLGSVLKVSPPAETLAKYLRQLGNVLLQDATPPFSELPCVVELDTFAVLVNLHYAHSTLFTSLTTSPGSQAVSSVIPPLEGMSDQYIVRVTTAAHILQYLLSTHPPTSADTVDQATGLSPELSVGMGLQNVWVKCRQAAGLSSSPPPSPYALFAGVQQHLYPFLECATLFFHCLSGVELIYSSASMVTRFEDLCRYLTIPVTLYTLFDEATPHNLIPKLVSNWCSHPKIKGLLATPPVSLVSPRKLYELPGSYSVLVKEASSFRCVSRVSSEASEDSQTTMLCLVCGQLLCANSYCCQTEVQRPEGGVVRVGGFTKHVRSCGAGLGMALWILESHVVLLDATDPNNVLGCTATPPYLDEYGEADPGLRRGNPLTLNEQMYQELKQLWFNHRIPERISKEMEENHGLSRITWVSM